MTASVTIGMLQRACSITDQIMSGVRPEQFGEPTPCSDWTVRELMEHIVASTDFFADAVENGMVADDREWPGYSPEELLPAYRRHAERQLAGFREPGRTERPMVILAGPPTAAFCLQIAVSERLVHEFVAVNSEVRLHDPAPIGPEITVDTSASPVNRLMALLGRDPSQAPS
jgi:uncharacterized protein (TIGR03083 family)